MVWERRDVSLWLRVWCCLLHECVVSLFTVSWLIVVVCVYVFVCLCMCVSVRVGVEVSVV